MLDVFGTAKWINIEWIAEFCDWRYLFFLEGKSGIGFETGSVLSWVSHFAYQSLRYPTFEH